MQITLRFATQGFGIENTWYLKNPWIIRSCLLSALLYEGRVPTLLLKETSYRKTQAENYRKI